ncbi:unnamed protein product [Kuraishia capsulata CBS 1993]|uniref:Core Histone H2A/H2B/H3 domain-containing protein n=1 Tax=Kuraishia capsulata CBS 1993 TaxID=1382522 RepID=W6MQG0_9ASCO|nr:uncharacterized protein KUCA_T00004531001 [Kuraishia capsulata CBS 1993]CDK28548.1 unnamed protein product [Kuraishia capsulata CBS 1993]
MDTNIDYAYPQDDGVDAQHVPNDTDQAYQRSVLKAGNGVNEGDEEEEEEEEAVEDEEEGDFGSPSGAFANVGQGLTGKYKNILMQYWQETINSIEHDDHDFKTHQLPLARIKKVMKTDEEVKMISAEAPILFAKGCDIFITELTMRAWIHAEENKRRTLQKSDIAAALSKSDMFDFLIDIVPREEDKFSKQSTQQPGQQTQQMPPQQHLQDTTQHKLTDQTIDYSQYGNQDTLLQSHLLNGTDYTNGRPQELYQHDRF